MPFLEAFDREQFEVVAYAHVPRPDLVTSQLQGLVTGWRDATRMDDLALAHQIRADRIDIAIDLAGLTANSRLLALTARPAPVQMTYLGYPNTTGLPQIDYRITDPIADPDDADDELHTETLVRLPRCFLCYAVPEQAPAIGPPPSEVSGTITFGSFNSTNKINRLVVGLWAAVLSAVPGSQLLLKSPASDDPVAQATLKGRFAEAGVDPARIRFAPYAAHLTEHLEQYNQVDIALDTFPYNGTTTTCEALWMGVPVVTLVGDRHAARVGASLLHTIGFQAGITHTREDFVGTAHLLASQPELLRAARRGLRHDLMRSPLCDMHGHARALEDAFRAVWRLACEKAEKR